MGETKTSALSLKNMNEETTKGFLEKVKEQYVAKYAQDMLLILADQKKLQRALDRVNKCVAEVETGDFTAIDRYKKARRKLEDTDDGEF